METMSVTSKGQVTTPLRQRPGPSRGSTGALKQREAVRRP